MVGLGGWVRATSTAKGGLSGTLYLGSKRIAFRSTLTGDGQSGQSATILIPVDRKDRTKDITLNLEFRPDDDPVAPGLSGNLTSDGEALFIDPAWRHVWNAKTNPAFGNKDRTLNVAIENNDPVNGPQGDGYAIVKLTKAGLAKWAAKLGDGRKVTGSFTASPDGEIPLYAAIPYLGAGSVFALLQTQISDDLLRVVDTQGHAGAWIKLPTTNPKDRLYREGFDVPLFIEGAEFVKPATGQLLFGNPTAPPLPLVFDLTGGGIDSSEQLGGADPLDLDAQLIVGNKITVDNTNLPATVKFAPAFSAKTGLFSGAVTLSDASPLGGKAVSRSLNFAGLYIPDPDDAASSRIRGFFTLPELPDGVGQTNSNTPILSGSLGVGP